jgi:hypothetical protein
MAVLSRAGCNSGPCHGNLNGKGGFRLSLRGQDPDFDYEALTRDLLSRRIDRVRPEESLILKKATMTLAHEGGQRFGKESPEYRILERWLAQGAKLDPAEGVRPVRLSVTPNVTVTTNATVPLRAKATFSDGSSRDVTSLATFEPSNLLVKVDLKTGMAHKQDEGEVSILVRYLDQQAVVRLAFVPDRADFAWSAPPENNFIDKHIFAKLKMLRLAPSGLSSDSEFVRRVHLDTIGVLPSTSETRRFLNDKSEDKREKLIDALLERNEFADFWAMKWADLLRNEEKVLDLKGVQVFQDWIRRSIIDRKPLNEFARELIAARGSSYSVPQANFYRALREPDARAEATAQVFLGIRLQCAKCHNHPFDRWTQTDYHRFTSFFSRVQYRIVENNRTDRLDKHEFAGEQIIWMDRSSELKHPVNGEILVPRFLGADVPGIHSGTDRLKVLADWVAQPQNPFFAKTQTNRIWQHLMGRGLVDPGDDFRESNPASHPELLDELSAYLAEQKFDLRAMVRLILRSRSYQLTAEPTQANAKDEVNYSHGLIRPLQAEQLLDAMGQVLGTRPKFAGLPSETRAGQLPGVGTQRRRGASKADADKFLAVFGKPIRSLSCECERSEDTTLARAFQLITGPTLDTLLSREDNRIGKLLSAKKSDEQITDELYLAALSRWPSDRERAAVQKLLSGKERRKGFEDLAWGLINSKEFLLRR